MSWLPLSLESGLPWLVGGCLVASAYFQARGVSHLIAAELERSRPIVEVTDAKRRPRKQPIRGTAILKRNPFDSVTGPLDGSAPTLRAATKAPPPVSDEPRATDPKCNFGYVTLIVATSDEYAFASVETKEGNSRLARVGDSIADHRIAHIGRSRIWLDDAKAHCQMELGDKPDTRKRRPKRRKKRARKRRRRRSRSRLPKNIANKIEKVSATEYRIDRSALDAVLEKQATLLRGTRARPYKRGDDLVGLRLSRVRGGTLLNALGLKSGDIVKSINGFDIANPQKALEAYGRLRAASSLSLQVERRGKPLALDYQIQ